jgi:hypothetical protein
LCRLQRNREVVHERRPAAAKTVASSLIGFSPTQAEK